MATVQRPSLKNSYSAPAHALQTQLGLGLMSTNSTPDDEAPTRPFHIRRRFRRASQPPVPSSGSLKIRAGSAASPVPDCGFFSATSTDSGSSDDDLDWDVANFHGRRSDRTLEYLDLPVSLPYSIVSLRTQLLSYLSDLETRMRSFCQQRLTGTSGDDLLSQAAPTPISSSSDSSIKAVGASSGNDDSNASAATHGDSHLAHLLSQLDALRDDLRRLVALLPSAPPSFPGAASSAMAARSQSLAQDWERLSSTLSLPLGMGSGFRVSLPRLPSSTDASRLRAELPSLPALPSLPHLEFDMTSILEALSMQLPDQAFSIAAKMQSRLESLQDSVRSLTWREYLSQAKDQGGNVSMVQRFEHKLADLSTRSRARANSIASRAGHAVHEAEERLYQLAVELARNGQDLIHYEHLPAFFRNNEHILSGYRFIPIQNWPALLRSTFQIHNETGNIHTHLWGLAAIVPLFWPSKGLDDQTTPMDRLVQTVYLFAAAKCLTLSVSWHVMAGCSDRKWFERFACVDYTGIAWLVAASIWTTVYNCFYCQPNLALFYSFTTLLVGLAGAILPWAAWFNERKNKHWRIAVFLTMCFTALAPFSHAAFEHGFAKTIHFFSPILPSLAFYVGGLVFYATQFPESWAPGKFDTWGHSHQLWHIGIVLAIVCHYRAALIFHANRFDFSCRLPIADAAAAAAPAGESASSLLGYSRAALGYLAAMLPWSSSSGPVDRVSRPIDHIFAKVGGMEGIVGLGRADDQILHWRRLLGTLGNGAVGRGWDALVDWAQNFW
ncbi:HlyIII-domain-containing protein [Testicularia cyperi]|uniref:HlyIII-domain-containing protein n=1 Tax=Testicularia cyperi TaxID=1882483 RepID=A0A317XY50_9BASI|nr:HlyIII-domain-containing protein [Testicularia cyperi]